MLTGNGGLVGFALFVVALVIAICALLLWIELVVRQAAVLVGTLFLPVGFAGMVWESTAHWLRKLAEGLLAIILAKFVITAVVAVGASAVAEGGDSPAALILGAGILAVAVFTPYVLLSIIPLGTLAVAEGLSRRPLQAGSSTMSTLYWGQALLGGGGGGGAGGAASAAGSGASTADTGGGGGIGAMAGGGAAAGGGAGGRGRCGRRRSCGGGHRAHGGGGRWRHRRQARPARPPPRRRRLRPARRRPRKAAPVAEARVQSYHFGPLQTSSAIGGMSWFQVVALGLCGTVAVGLTRTMPIAIGMVGGVALLAAGFAVGLRAHRRPPGRGVVLPGAVLARSPGAPGPALGRRRRRRQPARLRAPQVLRRAPGPGRGGRGLRSGPRDLSGGDELRGQFLPAGRPDRAGPAAAGLG